MSVSFRFFNSFQQTLPSARFKHLFLVVATLFQNIFPYWTFSNALSSHTQNILKQTANLLMFVRVCLGRSDMRWKNHFSDNICGRGKTKHNCTTLHLKLGSYLFGIDVPEHGPRVRLVQGLASLLHITAGVAKAFSILFMLMGTLKLCKIQRSHGGCMTLC